MAERCGYHSWFDALKAMEEQMSTMEFDVVLIGAGSYGLPLAATAKRMGKVTIHIGGGL